MAAKGLCLAEQCNTNNMDYEVLVLALQPHVYGHPHKIRNNNKKMKHVDKIRTLHVS